MPFIEYSDRFRPAEQEITIPKEPLKKGSHILIVSDSTDESFIPGEIIKTKPMAAGVKEVLRNVTHELREEDYQVTFLHPFLTKKDREIFRGVHVPGTEYKLAIVEPVRIFNLIKDLQPDAIFNSTVELPLGFTTKIACDRLAKLQCAEGRKIPYTLFYSTNFDISIADWISDRTHGKVDTHGKYGAINRYLYEGARHVLTPTPAWQNKLQRLGLSNVVVWPHGVDSELFRPLRPGEPNAYEEYPWYRSDMPILLNFGRVAEEKNIPDFLNLPPANTHRVIIGDGPIKQKLEEKYADKKNTHFLGAMYGPRLAHHVRSADAMVFPSLFDTWGLVATEAGASGVPVIAYNVPGPGEVIFNGLTGIIIPVGGSLADGIAPALRLDRDACAKKVRETYSWKKAADKLAENLEPIHWKGKQ